MISKKIDIPVFLWVWVNEASFFHYVSFNLCINTSYFLYAYKCIKNNVMIQNHFNAFGSQDNKWVIFCQWSGLDKQNFCCRYVCPFVNASLPKLFLEILISPERYNLNTRNLLCGILSGWIRYTSFNACFNGDVWILEILYYL